MRPRLTVAALLGAFGVFGVLFGVWAVLLADLSAALGLTPGPLGAALSAGFIASLPSMVLAGRLGDLLGSRLLGLAAGLLLGASFAAFAVVGSYPGLVALLVVFLVASGVFDIAVNAAAIGQEQAGRRHVLPVLHAAFSGGGAAGAVGAGLLIATGMPFRLLYLGTGAIVAATVVAWALAPDPADSTAVGEGSTRLERRLFGNRLLLLLAGLTALGFLGEGAMESWAAIYLRSSLGLGALVGAGGVAAFHTAMLVGRLGTAAITHRLGRVRSLQLAGLGATAGMLLALATEQPALIIGGFLVVGFSLSAVAPIAFSLAGSAAPGRAAQASSVITTIGYAGFLIGPGLIGTLAELASLRVALGVIAAVGLAIAVLAERTGSRV